MARDGGRKRPEVIGRGGLVTLRVPRYIFVDCLGRSHRGNPQLVMLHVMKSGWGKHRRFTGFAGSHIDGQGPINGGYPLVN